ncbi:membrane protease YdiL (CAAX protease family) [Enterococcus sp. PF1-24]|uniref:CPBP family intramembrane glutamic endopeptidase n=1 Tax=unclassified Enterococcus TaxID=2608891 RepID=UPI002476A1BC|nr:MULTISPECIES: CPBP family intramembrane glutamic endopeptidase [unclassified Enterococcus]MDH6365606.1 membrane protease YdiL (CAAX protease family) [Enterococcus sp. PFB1-1]MDH6402708.1 membrane protease YdiL (CAAX protease family) [Enterococcus sp. PF1-24]
MKNKTIKLYLAISYGIMIPICAVILLLNWRNQVIYNTNLSFVAIALAGLSTAIAGAVAAKQAGQINRLVDLLRDFFKIRQPLRYYLAILSYFLLIFGGRLFNGAWKDERDLLGLPLLFITAILFGGVEEIGWRYLFQRTLEKKVSFSAASFTTFVLWGAWHLMYFVVDGSIFTMTGETLSLFLLGLLGNCFVLGCIFRMTKSLWLCVFFHALLNALTQSFKPTDLLATLAITIFSIGISLLIVSKQKNTMLST